jgi:hypothetical protein
MRVAFDPYAAHAIHRRSPAEAFVNVRAHAITPGTSFRDDDVHAVAARAVYDIRRGLISSEE